MNSTSNIKTIDKVRGGLKRRRRAEKRFRRYGLIAILLGISFLALLFTSIIGNGYSAFLQTYMQMEVDFDGSRIDPEGKRDPEVLSAADYSGIIKASMREQFPWVKKRKEKRKLYSIASTGASYQIREQVMSDPSVIGSKKTIWAPMDDDADMFFKGYVTPLVDYPASSSLVIDVDGREASLKAKQGTFAPIIDQVKVHLQEQMQSLRDQITEKQDKLAETTTSFTSLNEQYDSHVNEDQHEEATQVQQQIDEQQAAMTELAVSLGQLRTELQADETYLKESVGKQKIPEAMPSYLLATADGYIKLTSVESGQAAGEVLVPVKDTHEVKQGEWTILVLQTPQSDRRVSDQQAAWLLHLQQQGKVEKRFNTTFFTAGDSREPELAGIWSAAKGSFYALIITLICSFPIGVAAAIYLEEFAPQNRWTDLIEVNINNLAAVPSIVFGLLGLAMFINFFGMPRSAPLVGGLVLTLMTLPTIIIASRASLKSVPPSIREAALGIGASKVQMVFFHVLPLALPGMLTGTIIGMAQALGESAPLLMIGMVAFIVDIPQGFFDPATVLPVQIYLWADSPERAFVERTSAAIMVLLAFLVAMNTLAVILRKRFERRW